MENKLYSKIYPTGFIGLDFIDGGKDFFPVITDNPLIVIMGQSDCDKRTLAIQIANNVVKNYSDAAIFHDDLDDNCVSDLIDKKESYLYRFVDEIEINDLYCKFKMIAKYKTDNNLLDTPTVYILNNKCIKRNTSDGIGEKLCEARNIHNVLKRIIELCKSTNIILILNINVVTSSTFENGKILPFSFLNNTNTSTTFLANTVIKMEKKNDFVFQLDLIKNIESKENLKCNLLYGDDKKFHDIEYGDNNG